MNKLDGRGFRLGFATVVLFTGIAGDFWRNLIYWQGYGVVVIVIATLSIIVLVHNRRTLRVTALPYPLLAFLLVAFFSISWSQYAGFSTLAAFVLLFTTAAAVAIATTLSWPELLTVLGWVFKLVLGLSILFELIVSTFIRHPIYPVWIEPQAHPARLLYWSRDLLFDLGKIQGIVGNSSLLAMAALLGLIVFAIQLVSGQTRRTTSVFWIVVALFVIAITRSATIFVAIVVVALVIGATLAVRRARTPRIRASAYGGISLLALGLFFAGVVLRTPLLALLGKSSDGTGRAYIWRSVQALAEQRPAQGWGWLGYWIVWIPPFNTLKKVGGVQPPHAHNAWLDVWLQVGIVGLIVFGALIASTVIRSWLLSVDRVILSPSIPARYSWISLLPILMLTAQLVQSVAESRILLEGGWMLLVIWAVKSKRDSLVIDGERALPVGFGLSRSRLRT